MDPRGLDLLSICAEEVSRVRFRNICAVQRGFEGVIIALGCVLR